MKEARRGSPRGQGLAAEGLGPLSSMGRSCHRRSEARRAGWPPGAALDLGSKRRGVWWA